MAVITIPTSEIAAMVIVNHGGPDVPGSTLSPHCLSFHRPKPVAGRIRHAEQVQVGYRYP
jgi:hypothetical protein